MRAARAFLSNLIDYAGLFPPASLGMHEAVQAYASYISGHDSDLLGRFVLPFARLDEFAESAAAVLPRGTSSDPWRVSLIAGSDLAAVRDSALHFNCSHWKESEMGHAVCDSIETPVADAEGVTTALSSTPEFFQLFLEVPLAKDPTPVISAIAGTRAFAKMRTGGVTPEAIPRSSDVIRFMQACRFHGVRFKATAGLHHALRAEYPLTYELAAPRGEMFGYLNVFLAAAFLDAGSGEEDLVRILEEGDASAFRFDDDGVTWHDTHLSVEQLQHARERFALSYGSCSFTEPVGEARELGLID